MSQLDTRLSKLQVRILSALLLGPMVIAIVYLGGVWFQAFGVFLLVRSLYEWFRMSVRSERKVLLGVLGGMYISATILCLYLIRMSGFEGFYHFVAFVVAIWASDSGAYFTGKLIGGPKLAPSLSPNKTIAGLCGSMFFGGVALAGSFLVHEFVSGVGIDLVLLLLFFLCGLFLGLVGQIGDLSISAMKRHVDVKDTGHLIPGHGGVLDRIDAMLLAAPFFFLFISFFGA